MEVDNAMKSYFRRSWDETRLEWVERIEDEAVDTVCMSTRIEAALGSGTGEAGASRAGVLPVLHRGRGLKISGHLEGNS